MNKNQTSEVETSSKDSSINDVYNDVKKIEEIKSVITERNKDCVEQCIVIVNSEIENLKGSVEHNQKKIKNNSGIINMCKRLISNVQDSVKSWFGGLFGRNKKSGSIISELTDSGVSLVETTKGTGINTIESRNSEQNGIDNEWILGKKAFGEGNGESANMKMEDIDKDKKDSATMR